MFDEEKGNFVSIKEGEEETLQIGEVSKVSAQEGDLVENLKAKEVDKGYYYVVETDKGTLTVNTWALLKALSPYTSGDTLNIKHTGRGKWEINKVDKAEVPF